MLHCVFVCVQDFVSVIYGNNIDNDLFHWGAGKDFRGPAWCVYVCIVHVFLECTLMLLVQCLQEHLAYGNLPLPSCGVLLRR